nr:glycosyltransferase family 39 protein [Sporolactobacillus kofuensis]
MTLLNIGIYFSWKLVHDLLGPKMSVMFLILTLTCLPIFFYSLYFYSDTLMIMMPPLLCYLWLRVEKRRRFFDSILFCMMLVIGCLIRQNLILFLPALIIFLILRAQWKRILVLLTLTIIMFLLVQVPLKIYSDHLHFEANPRYEMPNLHWVMLGLSEQGRYHLTDFRRSLTPMTQQQKKQVEGQEIKSRLIDRNFSELIMLWLTKAFRVYADGSLGYYWYTGNTLQHTLAYDYFFGGQKQLTVFVIQISHSVNLFCLLLSTLRFFRIKKLDLNLLIQIMLFGNYLFYIFVWEAEPRYALLFMFPMLIGNCYGLNEAKYLIGKWANRKGKDVIYTGTPRIVAHLLFCTLISVAAMRIIPLTQIPDLHYRYAVNQNQSKGSIHARIDKTHRIRQTFYADRSFDQISLGRVRSEGNGHYLAAIYALDNKKLVEKKLFTEHDLKLGKLSDLELQKALPGGKNYYLEISQIYRNKNARLFLAIHGKGLFEQRDLYVGGALYQNKQELIGKDLQFRVFMKETRGYLSMPVFIFLFSSAFTMLIVFDVAFRKEELDRLSLQTDIP